MRDSATGFTLVELMVVAAIIGILTTVAVPNFVGFWARSRRAEAQTALSSIAKTERAYFAEHDSYTDDLSQLGFTSTGTPHYLYGFTTDAVPAPSGLNDTAKLRAAGGGGFYSVALMIDAFGSPLSDADLPPSPVSKAAFKVGAVANLDRDPTLDTWTFDNNGLMVNVSSDLDD